MQTAFKEDRGGFITGPWTGSFSSSSSGVIKHFSIQLRFHKNGHVEGEGQDEVVLGNRWQHMRLLMLLFLAFLTFPNLINLCCQKVRHYRQACERDGWLFQPFAVDRNPPDCS